MLRLVPVPVLACLATALAPAVHASGVEDKVVEGAVDVSAGFPYAVFETTVEHADLAGCPEGFDTEKVFCRMAIASDGAHVFVFSLEGEQNLIAIKSYTMDDGLLSF